MHCKGVNYSNETKCFITLTSQPISELMRNVWKIIGNVNYKNVSVEMLQNIHENINFKFKYYIKIYVDP